MPMNRSHIDEVQAIVLESRTTFADATETELSAWVSLQDADAVEFLIIPDALANTVTVQVKTAEDASGTNEADLGKNITIPTDGDNLLVRIEVGSEELPTGHYFVNIDITSNGSGQDLNSVVALLYNFDTVPVTQDATVDQYIRRASTTVVTV